MLLFILNLIKDLKNRKIGTLVSFLKVHIKHIFFDHRNELQQIQFEGNLFGKENLQIHNQLKYVLNLDDLKKKPQIDLKLLFHINLLLYIGV